MRRGFLYRFALVVLVAAGTATATDALAAQGNAGATWSYLRALYRYERSEQAHFGASQQATEALINRATTQCPGVLASAPKGKQFNTLTSEVLSVALVTWAEPNRPALHRAVQTIRHLHWSDRRLSRLVRLVSGSLSALEQLHAPNVCSDAMGWAASGYHKLPQTVAVFRRRVLIAGSAGFLFGAELQKRLERYGGSRTKRLAHRLNRLGQAVDREELSGGLSAGTKLLKALGVSEAR